MVDSTKYTGCRDYFQDVHCKEAHEGQEVSVNKRKRTTIEILVTRIHKYDDLHRYDKCSALDTDVSDTPLVFLVKC